MPSLYGTSQKEMQQMAIDWYIRPIARLFFAGCEKAQSLVFAVAQYWDDEADDAVHSTFVGSSEKNPTWPECLNYQHNSLLIARGDSGSYANPKPTARNALERALCTVTGNSYEHLDDNGTGIIAFAPYTPEGGDQNQSTADNYAPFVIARRPDNPDDDVSIEIVGHVHKPHFVDSMVTSRANLGLEDVDLGPADPDDHYYPEIQRTEGEVIQGLVEAQGYSTPRDLKERIVDALIDHLSTQLSLRQPDDDIEKTLRSASIHPDGERVTSFNSLRRAIFEARKIVEPVR